MRANEIQQILKNYNNLPYKCIFFNGLWGIGKTYAVEHLHECKNITRVSLSALKNDDEIYSELLNALVFKNGKTKIFKQALKIGVDLASNFDNTRIASNVIAGIAEPMFNPKMAVKMFFKKEKDYWVVILDDFERVWDGIDITEVFRVVEFLTDIENVKVVVLGDLEKLPKSLCKKFNIYAERYIDKIYEITDIADDIDWMSNGLEIDDEFITWFRKSHGVYNLRSIIKANKFYLDVKNTILKRSSIIHDDGSMFWEDLRLVSFSLIIETFDKLKQKQHVTVTTSKENTIDFVDDLDFHVLNYLTNSEYGEEFILPLIKYYKTNDLSLNMFENIYLRSKKEDYIDYFYLDEKTIKNKLPEVLDELKCINNVEELIKKCRDYIGLCIITNENYSRVIEFFKKRLHDLINTQIENDQFELFDIDFYLYILEEYTELVDIVKFEYSTAKRTMIQYIVYSLLNREYDEKSLEIAQKLSSLSSNDEYKDILCDFLDKLICEKIFPINAHSEIQYTTCRIILETVYKLDSNKVRDYYTNFIVKSNIDLVAKHRCKCLMNRLGCEVPEVMISKKNEKNQL